MNWALSLVAIATLVAVAAIAGARVIEQSLMYYPARDRVPPHEAGLVGVEEVEIATDDGAVVLAWWAKAHPGQPTLLYFHGNGGSLYNRAERIRRYMEAGRGVFMMTYRGYGGSTGKPSERANVADGKRAYDTLIARGVRAADIIIYGESLGTGVAVQVAVEKPAAGLILDAPYTSILDVARLHYPYLPAGIFLRDRYETANYIARLDMPMLIVHGEADEVIPVGMGRALYAMARAPKELVTVPGAGHSDHGLFGSYDAIQAWIERLRQPAEPMRRVQGSGARP